MNALKTRLPFVLLSVMLMLALTGMGVSYGLWSETLTINGTVQTGEVEAAWVDVWCMDAGPDPYGPPGDLKDVGSTTVSIDPDHPQTMYVTVHNGYPSYYNDCKVTFQNTGTVPVIIQGYQVVPLDFTPASDNGEGDGEIWVKYTDGIGTQMEPCPADNCEQSSNLKFHVEQPALENHTYHFRVDVCLVQWNEPSGTCW
jgi:hypothetical protein